MAKRTAISIARTLAVTLMFFVGVLFAGHNFVWASEEPVTTDSISAQTEMFATNEVDATTEADLSSGEETSVLGEEADPAAEEDFVVATGTLSETDETLSVDSGETDSSTTTTDTEATSTESELEDQDLTATSSDPFVITDETASSTDATSTSATTTATTTEATSTAATSTSISIDTEATSTLATTTVAATASSAEATTTSATTGGSSTTDDSLTASSTLASLLVASSTVATTTLATTTLTVASSTEATSTTQSFLVAYYRYDDARNDMAGWGTPFSDIEGQDPGDPLSSSWTKDWFASTYFQTERVESSIRFKTNFVPFDDVSDPLTTAEYFIVAPNFGAHFMGLATVTEEGDYLATLTTDGDAWFYLDKNLEGKRLASVTSPADDLSATVHLVPGQQYVVDIYFTERLALYPYFDFTFPGVTIIPCEDDRCVPPVLDPDTTGPTAPDVTSPVPPISTTSTSVSFPITWTESTDPEIEGAVTSGLKGYLFVWDQTSDTVPSAGSASTTFTTATTTTITPILPVDLSPGYWWFHVVAVDNAGNVSSPTTHYGPFCIGLSSCEAEPATDDFNIVDFEVTAVDKTSFTVSWRTENDDGTDHPATTRLVWDTADHDSTATPNYGYANSTEETDLGLVTTHTVTITGLNKKTTYYFRAVSADATSTEVSAELSVTTSGSGGGGGGGGGSHHLVAATTTEATTTTEVAACAPYLLKFIKYGADNDPAEVYKLQAFLRVFEDRTDIPLSGVYDLTTYNAVRDFQSEYGLDVLGPWGIGDPTGYVFITTTLKINYLYCGIKDRITLDLRDVYQNQGLGGGKLALAGQVEGTSTASTSLVLGPINDEVASSGNRNSVQLAVAGLVGFFSDYPSVGIIGLLLILSYLIFLVQRRKDRDELEAQPKESAQDDNSEPNQDV